MGNFTVFQIGVMVSFAVSAVIGVIIFATGFGVSKEKPLPKILVWGTVRQDVMDSVLEKLTTKNDRFSQISYEEKDSRTYSSVLVNALAAGNGPDLFILPQELVLGFSDKTLMIPYKNYSEREFRDSFVEGGELFLSRDGIRALPFSVDPLVMYWNRDIFASVGLTTPPAFWDEFFVLSPKITKRDKSSNIVRSFVAFGEYSNVVNAKEVLSAFILQTGNPIVSFSKDGQIVSRLTENFDFMEPPALAALRFYTEFSNPVKAVYSWNRALPDSRQSFIAGDLALYIGFASEFSLLKEANPNLNFDVVEIAHSRDSGIKYPITFAHFTGLSISRASISPIAALEVAKALTSQKSITTLSKLTGLPPIRRDLLGEKPVDAIGPVFYNAAITARGWLDPDSSATDEIFKRMIESVVSGRALLREAVDTANAEINNLLR